MEAFISGTTDSEEKERTRGDKSYKKVKKKGRRGWNLRGFIGGVKTGIG